MTLTDCVALLKEVRGLEMVRAAITVNGLQDDWRYAVAAMDDRLNWDRYVLSQESAAMIAAAEERLYTERVAEVMSQPQSFRRTEFSDVDANPPGTTDDDSENSDARPTIH